MDEAQQRRLVSELTGAAIRQAIAAMDLPLGSRGVDAGCGAGQHVIWLAEAAGAGSRVHGVDLSAENLEVARDLVSASAVADRIVLARHNLLELDFPDDSFDWAWYADTLWPVGEMESVNALVEAARVVRPGGRIGVVFWSGQQLLAGHPALEARLNEAHARHAPHLDGVAPGLHFLRARGWMREAGLNEPHARTFVAEIEGPVEGRRRAALAACCEMLWGDLKCALAPADWTDSLWLRDPTSAQFVGDQPDYYGFVTSTLFTATVPG